MPNRPEGGDAEDIAALKRSRLAELERLFRIGKQQADRLATTTKDLPPAEEIKLLIGRNGSISEFERIARAIRQIIVLEFELHGLLPAPDRDAVREPKDLDRDDAEDIFAERERNDLNDLNDLRDYKERSDYRLGPLDEVVAEIRKALKAEPPQNDPFAPRARRIVQAPTAELRTQDIAKKPKIMPRRPVSAAIKAGIKTEPSFKATMLRGAASPRPDPTRPRNGVPSSVARSRTRGPPD